MVKKSAPLLEVERLLDLVPFLSVNPYITLKELATEFGVTEREMSNELVALSMCGLPGYTPYELIDVSFDSGYVSINNHQSLDLPRALSSSELSAFLLGLNIIKDSLQNSSQSKEIIDPKIAQVSALIARLHLLLDTPIDVDLDTSSHYLSEIEKAISQRGLLSIRYLSSAEDESKERQIQPLSLRKEGLNIYLAAYCLTSGAHRNFRLDRVENLSRITPSLLPPEIKQPVNFDESINEIDQEKPEIIRLKIKRNKRRYSELLNIESIPASGIVEISVFSQAWLVRALCAAQGDIEILSGAEVAGPIVARSTKILALYQS
jgi:proteasome accessory factor C